MRTRGRRKALLASSALVLILGVSGAVAQSAPVYQFDIPAEKLGQALKDFSATSSQEILFSDDVIGDRAAPALHGRYTRDQALAILLQGSDLRADVSKTGVIMVRPKNAEAASNEGAANADQNAVETVIVTGSRLPQPKEGAQEVFTYTAAQITESGQTTVTNFLNTLPTVSVNSEGSAVTTNGPNTVQLRGLPAGTTLVLINGHRVASSGQTDGTFFDLNNIPAAAIARVEVLPVGSSAIYGSDAIAGVVNIILKSNLDETSASATYGTASHYDEQDYDATWGRRFERGSISLAASYEIHNALFGFDTRYASNDNFSKFAALGGADHRFPFCNPGTIFSLNGANIPGLTAPIAAIPPGLPGAPTIQDFAATAGNENLCSFFASVAIIPRVERYGIVGSANYEISSDIQLFADVLYSRTRNDLSTPDASVLFAVIPASNAFNPFGSAIGIFGLMRERSGDVNLDNFVRPLVGARGKLFDDWEWEATFSYSRDDDQRTHLGNLDFSALSAALASSDPTVAFNPFALSPLPQSPLNSLFTSSTTEYLSESEDLNAFVRGSLFTLDSGSVELVAGVEGEHDHLTVTTGGVQSQTQRDIETIYGETRVPIIGNVGDPHRGDVLALTGAVRYDHYSDFQGRPTPQVGVEFRPSSSLLVRASYAEAYKAPVIDELSGAQSVFITTVVDTQNNNEVVMVPTTFGGNPHLSPETGTSKSAGILWTSDSISNLVVSANYFEISENNRIVFPSSDVLIAHPNLFPGRVTRNGAGQIIALNQTFANFGSLDVQGVDLGLNYKFSTSIGEFSPGIAVTVITRYVSSLVPGQPLIDRLGRATDEDSWAPRYKGTAALAWQKGLLRVTFDGRYVGSYLDYQTPPNHNRLGDTWFVDGSVRYDIGNEFLSSNEISNGVYMQIAAVNIFDVQPKYSNFRNGIFGFDPSESDLLGRFVTLRLGVDF